MNTGRLDAEVVEFIRNQFASRINEYHWKLQDCVEKMDRLAVDQPENAEFFKAERVAFTHAMVLLGGMEW